jgi:hypothetical protein
MQRLALCVVICASLTLLAADDKPKPDPKPAAPPNMAEMMAKFMELATPGENHKRLDPLVGEFKGKAKVWMMPGAPPQESEGVTKNAWIMGKRWLKSDFSGQMMGQPFTGMHLLGYDNYKKKYVSVWLDEMSTGLMLSEGTADEAGKVITQHCEYDDPMTNKKQKARIVTTFIDADSYRTEMFGPSMDGSGNEVKQFEITYTRVK